MKMRVLNVSVQEACNSRCRTCSIWKTRVKRVISSEIIQSALARYDFSEVKDLSLTGGEPFLHRDLRGITETFLSNLPSLEAFSVTTNGMLPEKIKAYAAYLKELKIPCRFAVSLEGTPEIHDNIRGVICYEKVITTIQEIAGVSKNFPLVELYISATMTRLNATEESFSHLMKVCADYNASLTWRVIQQSDVYYKNTAADLRPTPQQYSFLIEMIDRYFTTGDPYYRELREYLKTGAISPVCPAGKSFGYLDSDGKLFPCPFIGSEIAEWNSLRDRSPWEHVCSQCCTECRIYPSLQA